MKPLRLLIADDHDLVRRGLRAVLESRPQWIVCGEAHNGREAVRQALELKPDVIVMDLAMPELNGLEATRQILRKLDSVEIVILSMHESEQLIQEVLAAGARGYVLKSDAGHVLLDAVDSLQRHQPYFTSKVSALLLDSYLNPDQLKQKGQLFPITAREREIILLVAEGKSSKEIATHLNISVRTAETHRGNIMRKLDVHSASEIVRFAIRNKWVAP